MPHTPFSERNGVGAMELENRARSYYRIANALFAQKKMRGRVTKATRGARHLSLFIRLLNPLDLDTALKLAEPLALATNTPAVVAGRLVDRSDRR